MSKLSELFGRKGGAGSHGHSNGNGHKRALEDIQREIEPETPSDVGSRVGEENEALRNLLFDTGRKINELDESRSPSRRSSTPSTMRCGRSNRKNPTT